jgi:hypothetical protein
VAIVPLFPTGGTAAPGVRVRTLLQLPRPVCAFAADKGRGAWLSASALDSDTGRSENPCGPARGPCTLTIRELGGATRAKPQRVGRAECGVASLALAGRRALWATDIGGNVRDITVGTSLEGARSATVVDRFSNLGCDGHVLAGLPGGAETLVYAVRGFRCDQPGELDDSATGVWRVAGGQARLVPGATPGAVAVANGLIAVFVPRDQTIELRKPIDGALVSRATATGPIAALALSSTLLVAVVDRNGGKATGLELFSPRSGAAQGSIELPIGFAGVCCGTHIALTGRTIVLWIHLPERPATIWTVDTRTKQASVLVRTADTGYTPIGLGVDHGRVLWAENVDAPNRHGEGARRARIRATSLPAP